jgi:putative membrane-bound dehydrogenase-like protein
MSNRLRAGLCMRSLLRTVAAMCVVAGTVPNALAIDFPQPPNTEKSTTRPATPGEVCKTVSLPAGFHLTPFAAEPDVQNPIAITTDDRGRLWVAENYTWAGADAGNFDTRLRDHVVILEDTDGDGKHDKRTVFYDQAKRLTSVQVGMGGVWLLCPPQLLFVPDKNRDDVPDGPAKVILDGFDIRATSHTVANGLKWGPDGWLYGRQGILGTSNVGAPGADAAHRFKMNTGVWRYHPTRHVAEVVMHGMTNPWGFDYDPFGEAFVTNTVIGHLWHVIPGARTERMSGFDFNPYAYQLLSQTADHVHWNSTEVWTDVRKGVTDRTSAAGGGHAHTGLMIYQGDNWPAEYRGRAYTLNIHGQRLNCDILARKPVGYVATHGSDMCFVADSWFRGMDVISGVDGGVFIADWSDTGECHEIGGVHRTSGRIYKLTYGKIGPEGKVDVAHASDEQLVNMQTRQNDWFARRARLILQERAADGSLDTAACRKNLLQLFCNSNDPVVRIRAMWALKLCGCVDDKWLVAQLHHADEHIRVWAVRLLTDSHANDDQASWSRIADEFNSLAQQEPSGLVLLYLASALQKIPAEMRWNIAAAMSTRPERAFANDRTLAIMLWLGMEPVVTRDPARSLQLLKRTTFALIRENIARRFTSEIDSDVPTVEKLLALAAAEPRLNVDILRGIATALNGRKNPPVPAIWNDVAAKLAAANNGNSIDSLNVIGIAFKDKATVAKLRQMVEDSRSPPDGRVRALELLLTAHPKDLSGVLRKMVTDRDLTLAAIHGLAAYDDRETPTILLESYGDFTPAQRVAAVNTLASRVDYARALVRALESNTIKPTDISAVQARQVMALGDASIRDRLRAMWGDVRQTSAEKRKTINNLRATLTPKLANADLENGKAVFTKTCATCHVLFGQGAKIGPDLTGSNRKNLDYLLENIVDPSAVVAAEFRVSSFVLSDGRVLNGIVREQSDKTLTVETVDSKQVIDRKSIDETSVSDKSLMPDGLLQLLNGSQIRDLIAYLMSQG